MWMFLVRRLFSFAALPLGGVREGVLMIEGEGKFVREEDMMRAIEAGHAAVKVLCEGDDSSARFFRGTGRTEQNRIEKNRAAICNALIVMDGSQGLYRVEIVDRQMHRLPGPGGALDRNRVDLWQRACLIHGKGVQEP